MNVSESIAYEWLIAQDYTENEIIYNPNKSPDFITITDNRWWECKRLYGNTISIWEKQAEVLFSEPHNTFIIVVDYYSGKVCDTIHVGSIRKGQEVCKNYNISWITSFGKMEKNIQKWLIRQGYNYNYISHTSYGNVPLFITKQDNKKWLYRSIRNSSITIPIQLANILFNSSANDISLILYDAINEYVVKCTNLSEILNNDYINDIEVKWIHDNEQTKVLPVKEETLKLLNKLRREDESYDSLINDLITNRKQKGSVESAYIPNNYLLPVLFTIKCIKNGEYKYLDTVHKLISGTHPDNIDRAILHELIKYKMIYRDELTGNVKVLSTFAHRIEEDKVIVYIAYNTDFCRMFCDQMFMCEQFLNANKDDWLGNVYEYNIEHFENSSIQELIGECILQSCIEKED